MSRAHERSSLVASSLSTSTGAAAFFDAPTAEDHRASSRRFSLALAVVVGASSVVAIALTADVLANGAAIRAHGAFASLGSAYVPSRWRARKYQGEPWKPNVPLEAINTPELAFAELGRIRLTEAALALAQSGIEGKPVTFGADAFLDAAMSRRKLETPVYVIAVEASEKDVAKATNLKRVINEAYHIVEPTAAGAAGANAQTPLVKIQNAVNAAAWPNTIDLAIDAAAPLEAVLPLKSLYYLNALDQARNSGNVLPQGWHGIAHHVGCLYSHLRMWQLHARAKNKWTIIFESDGLYFLALAPWQLQSVADNAPSNADVIFLHKKDLASGQFVKQWRTGDEMMYLYNWDKVVGGAGLSGYMIGPNFTEKINNQILAWRGADMVDAWLMLKMCDKKDSGDYNDAHRINCYHAQRGAKPKQLIGGYLPDWYGVDKTTRWTDNWAAFVANEESDALFREAWNVRRAEFSAAQAIENEQKRAVAAAKRAARARARAELASAPAV